MTKEEFLSEMKWFLEYYDKVFNDTQTRVWFDCFSDLSKSAFYNALKKHIITDESPFFPALGKIANILKPGWKFS